MRVQSTRATVGRTPVAPWWVRAQAPWVGRTFENAVLGAESPEEQRIQRIREAAISALHDGMGKISLERARLVAEAYAATEGEHPAMRRAKAADRVFREIPIELMPGQLLAGTPSSGPGITELGPDFITKRVVYGSLDYLRCRESCQDALAALKAAYPVTREEEALFATSVWRWWRYWCPTVYIAEELRHNHPAVWYLMEKGGCFNPVLESFLSHTVADKASIVTRGLNAIKADIGRSIAEFESSDPDASTFDRLNLYRGMVLVADGLIAYANRCADRAEADASVEPDPARAAELREIARICRKVPAEPSETWWEALQSHWFLCLGTTLVESGAAHAVGRFDQYMYPYLQRDLAEGRISRQRAQELLECWFLKWHETGRMRSGESEGAFGGQKLDVGGMDEYGRDCTNSLSYMLLEAHAHVHLDNSLSVRLHRNSPHDFLQRVLEVVRLGGGLPILVNDDVIAPALASRCGVAVQHARHYADLGCQENVTDPNMTGADANGRCNSGWFNLVKPIELALHNGVNVVNGEQVGLQTGDPRAFSSMDRFLEAVKAQVEYVVAANVTMINVGDIVGARYFPCVFHDLLHPGPRRSGVDIKAGGCRYNWTGSLGVGMANAGDCLAAIDQLIFRQKETTWDELLAALVADWQGYEDLRAKAIGAPKYGCDDDFADGWAKRFLDIWFDAFEKHSTPRGGHYVCGLISMATYIPLGRRLGATPDGRKKGERLADAASPSPYAPAVGPTATHRSAAKAIDTFRTPNGVTFNQRLTRGSVASERDLSKWADLVRTYMDAGGQQVQYDIVDSATLRAAQAQPEDFRDLFVRVGGYSGCFVDMSRELQDSIIARAEQGL